MENLLRELIEQIRGLRSDLGIVLAAHLSREQAAAYLNISLSQLEKFQQQGLLKPKKLGRRTMFVKENLDDFAQNCLQESDKSFVQKKIREAGL